MTWGGRGDAPAAGTGSGPVCLAGNPVAPRQGVMPGFEPCQGPGKDIHLHEDA